MGGVMISLLIVFNIIYPILIKNIIEKFKEIDFNNIILLAVLYGSAILLSYLGDIIYNKNKYKAAQEIRDEIFRYSFYFPVKKFIEKGSAYFAKLLNDQVNNAFVVLDYVFIQNIFLVIRTIVVLSIVFLWNKVLFTVYITNTLLVLLFSKFLNQSTRPYFTEWQELGRSIVETFENLHEIIAGKAIEKRDKKYSLIFTKMTNLAIAAEVKRINLDKIFTEIV
ncbi:ABC transporter ATP-binding protein [Anoxybacter fermentans]|uniref:ABC transporter ATP-binding protein n=1 Tax=Anoxybacter fermentans TaxID=1323375 RepID=UPI000F8F0D27|nr:ABC transporter ATP-binding protein [Anoxybacter fermentans]